MSGYLLLAEQLENSLDLSTAYNFGPSLASNRRVSDLVDEVLKHWPGVWEYEDNGKAPHEAGLLNLVSDLAHHKLGWTPSWDFETTVERTINWYRRFYVDDAPSIECCLDDLAVYFSQENN